MITELKIENYKSIQDLTLDVGRVNVLIGENGCGKSNILEAITFAAAAEANKLDNEFLVSRGIRVTKPELMCSVFKKEPHHEDNIQITIKCDDIDDMSQHYILNNNNAPYSK
ncbi:MAG: AAA family ATPase, partial [Methylococcaceae bacterium]|nr:AAA family ATPase [Methylococcaceae bacterium]